MNKTINEGDACWVAFAMKDKDGNTPESAPTSLSYRIDNVTGGGEILGDTPVSPSVVSGELAITSAQNALVDQVNPSELHRVRITATFGVGDTLSRSIYIEVRNIGGVS